MNASTCLLFVGRRQRRQLRPQLNRTHLSFSGLARGKALRFELILELEGAIVTPNKATAVDTINDIGVVADLSITRNRRS